MTSVDFERFVGIDWSGAKSEFQRGIQVAEFLKGDSRPRLRAPPSGETWSRANVLDYIISLGAERTVVGIDFAFSVPWAAQSGSLPNCIEGISRVGDLWSLVDEFCKNERFFYAGPIWRSKRSPFREFVLCAGYKGAQFASDRLRITELSATPRPETIYKIIGAKTVGAGSFAGMRILHALRQSGDKRIAVWPFDDPDEAGVVVVEIYPSAFFAMAGQRRPNVEKDDAGLIEGVSRKVLNRFGIMNRCNVRGMSGDQLDALISSAALAFISQQPGTFCVPDALKQSVDREGWILGVSFGGGS